MLKRLAAVAHAPSARLRFVLVLALVASLCAAQEDAATVNEGPAATGTCDAPVTIESGLVSVHCISPPIRMTPGQVRKQCHSPPQPELQLH